MSDLTFLTSVKSVESHQEAVNDCAAKQGFPDIVSRQLGEGLVAIPAQHLSATIFAVSQKESGAFALKVSISGTMVNGEIVKPEKGNYNFRLSGWVKADPICPGVDPIEGAMVISSKEADALLAFKKGSKLWFDLSGTDFLYLVLALGKENHYAKDAAGNKIPAGTDSQGRQLHQLEEHDVITFPLGMWVAPLSGSGTSGGITEDGMANARARAIALMSEGRSI
jgi:hypothetical protein